MFRRFFGRRRRRADGSGDALVDLRVPKQPDAAAREPVVAAELRRRHERQPVDPDAFDELFAEVLAAHFDSGHTRGKVAYLGISGIEVRCQVSAVHQFGTVETASLFMEMSGGSLGDLPVFASVSGYGETAPAAVISGACTWACTFGPVLMSGLTGAAPEGDMDELQVIVDGQPFRLHVNGFDRVINLGTTKDDDADDGSVGGGDGSGSADAACDLGPSLHVAAEVRDALVPEPPDYWERQRPWLVEALVSAGALPALTSKHTMVSVFVMDMEGQRTVEVKVNGSDWPVGDWLADTPTNPGGAVVLLRELAVLTAVTPTGAQVTPTLTRDGVERTLVGLALRDEAGRAGGWQGWWSHDGWLGSPLTEDDLAAVERHARRLPEDYRRFLTTVAGPGAGPGYGLLQPERVTSARADVIPLAHAGCGVTWVLRLDGRNRGEVWVDAAGSDQRFERVAASVTEWFTSWVDLSIRDVAFVQWDPTRCATAHALSQLARDTSLPVGASLRDKLADGSISLTLGEGYLPTGAAGDPCQGCVELAAAQDLSPHVFAPGILSRPV